MKKALLRKSALAMAALLCASAALGGAPFTHLSYADVADSMVMTGTDSDVSDISADDSTDYAAEDTPDIDDSYSDGKGNDSSAGTDSSDDEGSGAVMSGDGSSDDDITIGGKASDTDNDGSSSDTPDEKSDPDGAGSSTDTSGSNAAANEASSSDSQAEKDAAADLSEGSAADEADDKADDLETDTDISADTDIEEQETDAAAADATAGTKTASVKEQIEALIAKLPAAETVASLSESEYEELAALLEEIEALAEEYGIDLTQYEAYTAFYAGSDETELLEENTVEAGDWDTVKNAVESMKSGDELIVRLTSDMTADSSIKLVAGSSVEIIADSSVTITLAKKGTSVPVPFTVSGADTELTFGSNTSGLITITAETSGELMWSGKDIFTVSGNASFNLNNVLISNIKYEHPASKYMRSAVYVDTASANIDNVEMSGCDGYAYGVFLYQKGSSTVSINKCKVHDSRYTGNSGGHDQGGGVIYTDKGTLTITGSEIRDNHSACLDDGWSYANCMGALNIYNTAVNISDTVISGNKAVQGAGIRAQSCSLELVNVKILDNQADGKDYQPFYNAFTGSFGAGIALRSCSSVSIKNTEISGNKNAGLGGGISAIDTNLELDGSVTVRDNSAVFGGGIYIEGGTVTVNGAEISNNAAVLDDTLNKDSKALQYYYYYGAGGGVGIWNSGKLVLNSGSITDNTAEYVGGGVYIEWGSKFDVAGGSITGNAARSTTAYTDVTDEYKGDAVFLLDDGKSRFGISGSPDIEGDVFLTSGAVIDVTGEYTGSNVLINVEMNDAAGEYADKRDDTCQEGRNVVRYASAMAIPDKSEAAKFEIASRIQDEGYTSLRNDELTNPDGTPDKHILEIYKAVMYKISYEFESTDGRVLPDAVTALLPREGKTEAGSSAVPKQPEETSVMDGNASWIFRGYDKEEIEDIQQDAVFTGKWEYVKGAATVVINSGTAPGKTYDTQPAVITAGDVTTNSKGSLSFVYEQKNGDSWTAVSEAVDAGEYRVKAVAAETEETLAAESDYLEFAITKATPDCTAPQGLKASEGDTLQSVKLPDGWSWKSGGSGSVGAAGTHTFTAVFTPADTRNYNIVEAELTVTVSSEDDGDDGGRKHKDTSVRNRGSSAAGYGSDSDSTVEAGTDAAGTVIGPGTAQVQPGTVIDSDGSTSRVTGHWIKGADTAGGSAADGTALNSGSSADSAVYESFVTSGGEKLKNCWAYLDDPYMSASAADKWYRFDSDGELVLGWYKEASDGTWYYLNEEHGDMLYGWHYDAEDSRWYYLDLRDGHMYTGWHEIGGRWYFFNMTTPENTWDYDGTRWNFNGSDERPYGSMYRDEKTPDNYTVDNSGAWTK